MCDIFPFILNVTNMSLRSVRLSSVTFFQTFTGTSQLRLYSIVAQAGNIAMS